MPIDKIPGRGKIVGWRTIKDGAGYRRVAIVSKAGPKGGRTVVSPVAHERGGAYAQKPKPLRQGFLKNADKKHTGPLTAEIRRHTGDPSAILADHHDTIRAWSNERRNGKLTKRALRSRFYLHKIKGTETPK